MAKTLPANTLRKLQQQEHKIRNKMAQSAARQRAGTGPPKKKKEKFTANCRRCEEIT